MRGSAAGFLHLFHFISSAVLSLLSIFSLDSFALLFLQALFSFFLSPFLLPFRIQLLCWLTVAYIPVFILLPVPLHRHQHHHPHKTGKKTVPFLYSSAPCSTSHIYSQHFHAQSPRLSFLYWCGANAVSGIELQQCFHSSRYN